MNRSFRAEESLAKQRMGSLRSSIMKEKDEELGMFLEMRRREKERQDLLLLQKSEEFDAPLGPTTGSSPVFNISAAAPARKTASDDFLNSDNDKNDYDWLLTPPGTPLFPSLEMNSHNRVTNNLSSPKARPTALKSRLANPTELPHARSNLTSRQPALSPGNSSNSGLRRSSSSSGSRSSTPTGRSTLTSSRSTLTSVARPTTNMSSKGISNLSASKSSATSLPSSKLSRSATPTSRSVPTSTKSAVPPRSSTPNSRSTARPSTPTSRPSIPGPKLTSRASTPTRRPVTSPAMMTSAPARSLSSSSVSKSSTLTASRNPVPPRASSPTVKPRPWNPSEMPGYSLDAPPNLRTSLSDRPASVTRGRPGAPSSRSSSIDPSVNGRGRRQSCSPSRGRPPNGIIHNSGSSVPVPAMSRLHAKANDNMSPVAMGNKMVERVINMRKLAPPRQDGNKHSPSSNLSAKSSSPDSTGFGRTLSKKSLDMAMRHMDIRRTIPGNLRPLMTNIPASSMYSVRSGHSRSRTVSVSDSPLATSSNASSEVSVNNNALCVDDVSSDRGGPRSPTSIPSR